MSRRSTYSFPQAPLFIIETEVQCSERQENMLLHHICPGLSVTYLEFLHILRKYCSFWCRKFPPLGFLLNFADTILGSIDISLYAVHGLARSSHRWVGGRHEVAVKVEVNFRAQGQLISWVFNPEPFAEPQSGERPDDAHQAGTKKDITCPNWANVRGALGRPSPSICCTLRPNIPTADCKDLNSPEICVPKSL